MKEKFLTKNTKITIKEDTNYLTPPPPGLKTCIEKFTMKMVRSISEALT